MAEAPEKNYGNRGKGRPRGARNKVSRDLKASILEGLARAGEKLSGEKTVEAYIAYVAVNSPSDGIKVLTALMPKVIEGGGEDGEHVARVTFEWETAPRGDSAG